MSSALQPSTSDQGIAFEQRSPLTNPAAAGVHAQNRDSSIVARAFAIAVLAVLLKFWFEQHAGWGSNQPALLAAILAGFGFGPKVLDYFLKGPERGRVAARIRSALRAAISTPVIVVLWVLAVVLVLTWSSVEVIGESPEDAGSVTVAGSNGGAAVTKAYERNLKPAHFSWVRTSPFGRTYRVTAPGYVSASFPVYPALSLRLTLGKELSPSPSVLLRPDIRVLTFLKTEGSRVTLSLRRDGNVHPFAEVQNARSILIGREQQIPQSMLQDWQLELGGVPHEVGDPVLLVWKHPQLVKVPDTINLAPHMRLIADVFSQQGKPVGHVDIELSDQKLIDVEIPWSGS